MKSSLIPRIGKVAAVWFLLTIPAAQAAECHDIHPTICTMTTEIEFNALQLDQPLQHINFETLPNGQRRVSGTQITPSFNYTPLGVTFTAPAGVPTIAGSGPGQFGLQVLAFSPPMHTWLRADFTHPSSGAGIYFNGATNLTAFGTDDSVIATLSYGFSGGPWFIGIYSEIPIGYVIADRNDSFERIGDFIFNLVPEPASAFLLCSGIPLIARHSVPWSKANRRES